MQTDREDSCMWSVSGQRARQEVARGHDRAPGNPHCIRDVIQLGAIDETLMGLADAETEWIAIDETQRVSHCGRGLTGKCETNLYTN